MPELQVKKETFPERCEICHQKDKFDAKRNYCSRCNLIAEEKQQRNSNAEIRVHIGGIVCGMVGSIGWCFLPTIESLQSFDLLFVKMIGGFFFTIIGTRLGTKMGPTLKNYVKETSIVKNDYFIHIMFILLMGLITSLIIGATSVILMLSGISSIFIGAGVGILIGVFVVFCQWITFVIENI